jgi:uncharacterized protein with ATP-grasp and redox domains
MNTKFDCALCSINGVLNLFKKGLIEEKYQEEILKSVMKYYSTVDYSLPSTTINRGVKNIICEISGLTDPFKPLKEKVNLKALEYYKKYEKKVKEDKNSWQKAMRLAIAGNIIDFGPTHNFDIEKKIEEVMQAEFPIDDSEKLFDRIKHAKSILYIGDNTGEIVFDKLFLEVIKHPNITFVVRNKPILNDSTMEDAKWAGIDKLAKQVITTGDDAPGVLLDSVSEEFLAHYNSADLIISKGQGNFEGLGHVTDKNMFFLFTVKCKLISAMLNIPIGKSIVKCAQTTNI